MLAISSFTSSTTLPRFSILVAALALLAMMTVISDDSDGVVLQDAYDVAANGGAGFTGDPPCPNCGAVVPGRNPRN